MPKTFDEVVSGSRTAFDKTIDAISRAHAAEVAKHTAEVAALSTRMIRLQNCLRSAEASLVYLAQDLQSKGGTKYHAIVGELLEVTRYGLVGPPKNAAAGKKRSRKSTRIVKPRPTMVATLPPPTPGKARRAAQPVRRPNRGPTGDQQGTNKGPTGPGS